jgi:hypothetical protein
MMRNGTNSWGVSYSQIRWLEQLLRSHGNIVKVARHDDIVFEIDRKHQEDHFSVVCLNEYTMGLTAVHRVFHEFGKPGIIYVGGGWCGYTLQAKEFCLAEHVGLYVSDEMSGGLWADEHWRYCKRDKDGDPVYHLCGEAS